MASGSARFGETQVIMTSRENSASRPRSSQVETGDFEPPLGNKDGVHWLAQIPITVGIAANVRVVSCPFRNELVAVESAPDFTNLKPAKNYMGTPALRVEIKPALGPVNRAKPAEE